MKERKSRKKLAGRKIFSILLLFLFLFLIFFVAFKTYKAFKGSYWQGKENFNLIISSSEGFYLLIFKPRDSSLSILVIPGDTYLQVPPRYGFYPLKSIYALGEQEFGDGGQLLSLTLSDFLGAPVKGWLEVKEKIEPNSHSLLTTILKNIFFARGESNLGLVDRFKVFLALSGVRFKSASWTFLEETTILTEVTRPDGQKFLKANYLLLDELLIGFFEEKILREEGMRLAVFNASGFEDLATKIGRILKNLGAEVVMVGNLPCKQPVCFRENSEILYKEERLKESATLKKIKNLYPLRLKEGEVEGIEADLALILGGDFWEKLVAFY